MSQEENSFDKLVSKSLSGLLTGQHQMSGHVKSLDQTVRSQGDSLKALAAQMVNLSAQMVTLSDQTGEQLTAMLQTSEEQEQRIEELLGIMTQFAQGQTDVRREQAEMKETLEEYGRRLDALEKKAS